MDEVCVRRLKAMEQEDIEMKKMFANPMSDIKFLKGTWI